MTEQSIFNNEEIQVLENDYDRCGFLKVFFIFGNWSINIWRWDSYLISSSVFDIDS